VCCESETLTRTNELTRTYSWEEYLEQDSGLAMTAMFLPAFLINLCLVVFVAAQYGAVEYVDLSSDL